MFGFCVAANAEILLHAIFRSHTQKTDKLERERKNAATKSDTSKHKPTMMPAIVHAFPFYAIAFDDFAFK